MKNKMIKHLKIMLTSWLFIVGVSTGQSQTTNITQGKIQDETQKQIEWVANLYEHGIQVKSDSLIVSAEVRRILSDEKLKDFLFPEVYTWESTVRLMEKMELKKAFWFMINLYPQNKELVMKAVIRYDQIFKMDKALTSALYTYAMIDPKVVNIENGKPVVKRPDLLEKGLTNVKEMVGYVNYYRTRETEG